MSRLGRVALPRRRARSLTPDSDPRAEVGSARHLTRLGGECEFVLRTCVCPGCFTRPTGDLGLQLSRRTNHVETWSPPYVGPILARMSEIRVFPAAGDADDQRSIDVYNAVHPREPVGPMESREWRRQSRHAEVFLAERDGELAGSAHIGIPSYTDTPTGQAYVLAPHRRLGVGEALYAAVS